MRILEPSRGGMGIRLKEASMMLICARYWRTLEKGLKRPKWTVSRTRSARKARRTLAVMPAAETKMRAPPGVAQVGEVDGDKRSLPAETEEEEHERAHGVEMAAADRG